MKSYPYYTKSADNAIAAARKQLEVGQTVTLAIRTHARLGLKVLLGGVPIVRSQNAFGASVGAALEMLIPGLDCRCAENNSAFIDLVVVLAGYRLTADPDGFHVRKAAASEGALADLRAAHEAEVRASAAKSAAMADLRAADEATYAAVRKCLYSADLRTSATSDIALQAMEDSTADLRASAAKFASLAYETYRAWREAQTAFQHALAALEENPAALKAA